MRFLPSHANPRRRAAATLIEILAVMAIITILAGLSFAAFSAAVSYGDKIHSDVNTAVASVRAHAGPTAPLAPAAVADVLGYQSAAAQQQPQPDRVPGQYFVALKSGGPGVPVQAQRLAGLVGGTLRHVYFQGVPGFALTCDDSQIGLIQNDPAVSLVDQDHYIYPCAAATTPLNIKRVFCNTDNTGKVGTKNGKPIHTSLYRLTRNTASQHHIVTGRRNLGDHYGSALVPVAIMDTGIDPTHPDLFVIDSLDFTGLGNGQDLDGHGTHLAGIVGARDNLAGGGVVGVYQNAPLISLKVMKTSAYPAAAVSTGVSSDVYAALEYILANPSGIRVCLMAFETKGVDRVMNTYVDAVGNTGILMVAAAGQNGAVAPATGAGPASNVSPASASQSITVGAMVDTEGNAWSLGGVGIDDVFAAYSNYGPRVDFVAPGGAGPVYYNINSTIPLAGQTKNKLAAPYSTNVDGNPLIPAQGTSFAAAHVAGMLAFIMDPRTNVGYVFPHGITTFRPLMTDRVSAINALSRLTHRSGWHNDVVNDGHNTTIPVANFYVNQFLK